MSILTQVFPFKVTQAILWLIWRDSHWARSAEHFPFILFSAKPATTEVAQLLVLYQVCPSSQTQVSKLMGRLLYFFKADAEQEVI